MTSVIHHSGYKSFFSTFNLRLFSSNTIFHPSYFPITSSKDFSTRTRLSVYNDSINEPSLPSWERSIYLKEMSYEFITILNSLEIIVLLGNITLRRSSTNKTQVF